MKEKILKVLIQVGVFVATVFIILGFFISNIQGVGESADNECIQKILEEYNVESIQELNMIPISQFNQ